MVDEHKTEGAARRPLGRRFRVGVAVIAIASAAALLGGTGADRGAPAQPPATLAAASPRTLASLLDGLSTGETASYVDRLERQVASAPWDREALILLGLAYQQRARETGDPTFLSRSGRALEAAGGILGANSLLTTGRAALALSRHRFREAAGLARQALELEADNASARGILGDAFLALGHYPQAFREYDRMAELAPGLASYARVAHARALRGRPAAAAEALVLGSEYEAVPEHAAWALTRLGRVEFDTGDLRSAEHAYRRALARYPGYANALAGLARVDAARGRYGKAAARLERVVAALPLPEHAALLGDVEAAAGRAEAASDAYALVGVIQRLFEANGVRTDLETALFDLDHDRHLADALVRARAAYAERKSIESEDVLSWALYKNARCREALPHSERALRLGTRDALKIFHRGMIELCLGRRAKGRAFLRRALAINPHFSLLYLPVAREALR
jgi:tetratricopeptide (TPR) repeat protein